MDDRFKYLIPFLLAVVGAFSLTAQHFVAVPMVVGGSYVSGHDDVPSDSLLIEGRVIESLAKCELSDAFMIPVDNDGNPGDTIKASRRFSFMGRRPRNNSYLRFMAERKDSTYVFEIGAPGYASQTVVYKVEHIGRREMTREMPVTILERAPHQLGEVQVVASKVKFYHRGDTLVYNADAFQLAEGSMLDELIRQLPGVELNKDGEIKVNGEKVETLLLNGKHFFSGDNKLMLENLGAYTVKDVEVYRGQTALEKWVNDPNAQKHLTMDVKLKKEYSHGYLLNAQAGYGTEERYLGRLFASWFSPTTNVSMVGNLNNVSDVFGVHGMHDSWRPSGLSGGDSRHQSAGLNYDVETNDQRRTAHGSVKYSGHRALGISNTTSATFYTDNQVYNYSYSRTRSRNMQLDTNHDVMFDLGRVNLSGDFSGGYNTSDNASSSLSASFNQEQADINQEIIENIYGDGGASALAALINRSRTLGNGDNTTAYGNISARAIYKVPGTSDILNVNVSGRYSSSSGNNWNDYMIDYGDVTTPSEHRRQYSDRSPVHNLNLSGWMSYTARLGKVSLDLRYSLDYSNGKSDTYMYSLQNLADMGDFGTLPPDYQLAFDPSNSDMSRQRSHKHSLSPNLHYSLPCGKAYSLSLHVSPTFALSNRRLDYWRDNKLYNIRHKSSLRDALSGSVMVAYQPSTVFSEKGARHSIDYTYYINTSLPDMMSLVDITDDTNPLYIREGNPDLKSSYHHNHRLSWSVGSKLSNSLDVSYSYTTDKMIQASTYDMHTGITRTRAGNVNGDNDITINDRVSYWYAKKTSFTVSANTSVSRMHSVDMISTNGAEPAKTTADTWSIGERVNLDWHFGSGHSLRANCDVTNRRTDSEREGFNKINAFHINYGLYGQVRLPAGFELNTSLSVYTRRGYGSKELDTTDAIWDFGATYTPKGKRWVFTVNAFDLLHRMSNVHYSVNAMGRTSVVTNSLPSYVIATVQYRLNIQPKKRKD